MAFGSALAFPGDNLGTRAPRASKEEDHFFVEPLPDPIKERITHGPIAAANAGVHLSAGQEQFGGQLIFLGNIRSGQTNPGEHNRFGFIVGVAIGVGFEGDFVPAELAGTKVLSGRGSPESRSGHPRPN